MGRLNTSELVHLIQKDWELREAIFDVSAVEFQAVRREHIAASEELVEKLAEIRDDVNKLDRLGITSASFQAAAFEVAGGAESPVTVRDVVDVAAVEQLDEELRGKWKVCDRDHEPVMFKGSNCPSCTFRKAASGTTSAEDYTDRARAACLGRTAIPIAYDEVVACIGATVVNMMREDLRDHLAAAGVSPS